MSIPNIDTFEHDISEEIKKKEATIGDIASAGGDIGNIPVRSASVSTFLIATGSLFIIAIVAISAFLFIKYSNGPAAPSAGTDGAVSPGTSLAAVSSVLNETIGGSVSSVQKSDYGYIVELSSYSDVFAFMLKNEDKYADEIAAAIGSVRTISTESPPFTFTDVTINNQNMRVGTSGSSTVVYAFVNTKILLISSSAEGILALRGAILR